VFPYYKDIQIVPLYTEIKFSVVSYTISPVAGVAMAFFCVVVIRGGKKPFVVELTNSLAEATSVKVELAETSSIPTFLVDSNNLKVSLFAPFLKNARLLELSQ
jgi:hypothetical protein